MTRFKSLGFAAVILLGVAAPGFASTLPPVDFKKGELAVAVGLFDGNLDYAITERLSLGISAMYSPYEKTQNYKYEDGTSYSTRTIPIAAVRATYRLGEVREFAYGLSASAGGTWEKPGSWLFNNSTEEYTPFVQVALNTTVPLWGDWLKLRATVGPVIMEPKFERFPILPWVWPNLELSARLWGKSELTFLGNGWVGWRGRF